MSSIVTLGYSHGKLLVPNGYGGHLVALALAQLSRTCINVLPGTRFIGFGTMMVNGKVVTSPVTLHEEGHYDIVCTQDDITAQLQASVIIPETTKVQIIDVIAPGTEFSSFKRLADALPTPFGGWANTRPVLSGSQSRVLVSTNKAVHISVRRIEEDNSQTEISTICTEGAGRWLTAEMVLNRGLNNTKLVLPIETGDQIIGTFTPPVTPVTPVTPITTQNTVVPIALTSSDDQEFVPQSGSLANSFNLVDETSPDDDTTYVTMSAQQQFASWKPASYTPPTNLGYIYSISIKARARRIASGVYSKVVWGPYLKNVITGARFLADVALETSTSYANHIIELRTNPFTNLPWQPGDLQSGAIHIGVQRDPRLDNIRVTLANITVNQVLT